MGKMHNPLCWLKKKKRTFPTHIFLCHPLRMIVAWVTQGEIKTLPSARPHPRHKPPTFLSTFSCSQSQWTFMFSRNKLVNHHREIYWLHNIPTSYQLVPFENLGHFPFVAPVQPASKHYTWNIAFIQILDWVQLAKTCSTEHSFVY